MTRVFARSLVALFGLAVFLSCGGGGGGGNTTPAATQVPGPANLKVSHSPGTFYFTWTPSTGSIDGYEFEGRTGTEAFQKLHEGLLPGTWTAAYLDAAVPELTDFAYRLRAKRGSEYSAYSNVATYHSGLNAPSIYASLNYNSGISVTWYNQSAIADTLLLERGATVDGGSTFTWTTIPNVAFSETSYLDRDATSESSAYAYRVTYSKGNDTGSATSSIVSIPMAPPTDLLATPLVEGVKLSWKSSSQKAEELVVMRAVGLDSYPSFQEVAHLPATATTFDDLQIATGFYTYRVEARKTGMSSASSAQVQVATLPPAGGISLIPQILSMPGSTAAVRNSLGAWSFAGGDYGYETVIQTPNGSGWEEYRPSNATGWVPPYLLLDAQDRPHTVFFRTTMQGSSEVAIIHAWFDGSVWQTEEVARRTLYSSSASSALTYALDASNNLHLVWQKDGSWGSASALEYAYKAKDGTWKTEGLDVVTPAITNLGSYRLIVEPGGIPHILLGSWQSVYHLFRGLEGSWSWESVPTGVSSSGWYDFLSGVAEGNDQLTVFFVRQHDPWDGNYDLASISKTQTGWSEIQLLDSTLTSSSLSAQTATSAANQRAAICYSNSQGTRLLNRANGLWTSVITGPSSYYTNSLGFDKNGKLYLLQRVGYSSGNDVPYVLYTEAP